jgi:cell shape-determining protein MreC
VATDRTRRRTWTIGASVSVILVVLYLSGGVVSGLRSAANFVTAPFTWTVNEIARPIGHMFAGAINYSDVVGQNQKLRYEDDQLDVPFVGNLPTVAAQVSAISPTNFAATVDISKGRDDGILAGMPVVANGGLVGVVTATTPRGRDRSPDHRRQVPDRRHLR